MMYIQQMRVSNLKDPSEIPVTECWREAYEALARTAGLEFFPTRAYLKAHPDKSRQFCHWLWRILGEHEGEICKVDEQACLSCQKKGLSKWTAMYVLAHVVRDEDPGLYIILQKKCKLYQKGSSHVRPNDFSPDDPPGPKDPLAARMPVPLPPVFTDAVARELRHRPWMRAYL